jgi:hypothetical protein
MKIVTLVENTCGHENCIAEHGLSLYIETVLPFPISVMLMAYSGIKRGV